MGKKNNPEIAKMGALFRTMPRKKAEVAVTTSPVYNASLSAYLGKWVWLRAITADITVLLGDQTADSFTAGKGLIVPTTDQIELFIDKGDVAVFSHVSTASATLLILYDDD